MFGFQLIFITLFGLLIIGLAGYSLYKTNKKYPDAVLGDVIILLVKRDTTIWLLLLFGLAAISEGMISAALGAGEGKPNLMGSMMMHIALGFGAIFGAFTASARLNDAIDAFAVGNNAIGVFELILSMFGFALMLVCPYINVMGIAIALNEVVHVKFMFQGLNPFVSEAQLQGQYLATFYEEYKTGDFNPRKYSPMQSMSQLMWISFGTLIVHWLLLPYKVIYSTVLPYLNKKAKGGAGSGGSGSTPNDPGANKRQLNDTLKFLLNKIGYIDQKEVDATVKRCIDSMAAAITAAGNDPSKGSKGVEVTLSLRVMEMKSEWDKAPASAHQKLRDATRKIITDKITADPPGFGVTLK